MVSTSEPYAATGGSRPLLSIAIPTYRRKHWLQKSLDSLIPQLRELPAGLVEIVISENGGDDGSWEYLQGLEGTETPWLRLNRNPVNIGAEANFYLLPGLTRGEYLWLLGDDDCPVPGALSEIIAELRKSPDYLVLNCATSDESAQQHGKPFRALDANKEVGSLRELCAYVSHFEMGFISAWIARRELFNCISEGDYKGFARWGLSLMADRYVGIARSRKGLLLARVMLLNRRPPVNEYPSTFDYFSWFFEGSTAVFRFLQGQAGSLDESIVRTRKAWMLKTIAIKRILYERATRSLNAASVNAILFAGYRDRWEYWLGCLPALYVPGLGRLAGLWLRSKARPGAAS